MLSCKTLTVNGGKVVSQIKNQQPNLRKTGKHWSLRI